MSQTEVPTADRAERHLSLVPPLSQQDALEEALVALRLQIAEAYADLRLVEGE